MTYNPFITRWQSGRENLNRLTEKYKPKKLFEQYNVNNPFVGRKIQPDIDNILYGDSGASQYGTTAAQTGTTPYDISKLELPSPRQALETTEQKIESFLGGDIQAPEWYQKANVAATTAFSTRPKVGNIELPSISETAGIALIALQGYQAGKTLWDKYGAFKATPEYKTLQKEVSRLGIDKTSENYKTVEKTLESAFKMRKAGMPEAADEIVDRYWNTVLRTTPQTTAQRPAGLLGTRPIPQATQSGAMAMGGIGQPGMPMKNLPIPTDTELLKATQALGKERGLDVEALSGISGGEYWVAITTKALKPSESFSEWILSLPEESAGEINRLLSGKFELKGATEPDYGRKRFIPFKNIQDANQFIKTGDTSLIAESITQRGEKWTPEKLAATRKAVQEMEAPYEEINKQIAELQKTLDETKAKWDTELKELPYEEWSVRREVLNREMDSLREQINALGSQKLQAKGVIKTQPTPPLEVPTTPTEVQEMQITKAEVGGKLQLIAKVDNKEVGEIAITPRQDGNYEVSNLLVWPEAQRKGYATELYRRAYNEARQSGKKLYISSDRTADAIALHERFTEQGILKSDGEIVFGEPTTPTETQVTPPVTQEITQVPSPAEISPEIREELHDLGWTDKLISSQITDELELKAALRGDVNMELYGIPSETREIAVAQAKENVNNIQQKATEPETVRPEEAEYSHVEIGSPDGIKPPPPQLPTKTGGEYFPEDIFGEIALRATKGERTDQTLLRLHEAAKSNTQRRTNIIVAKGKVKLEKLGIGTTRNAQLVARPEDLPVLDELYNALHNPSLVDSGEIAIPKGFEDIYRELRSLADWDTAARMDFDPEAALLDDWFFRGWKPPEGMYGRDGGRLGAKPRALKMPRVDATYQEMRDAGFEPLFWNPYQQWAYRHVLGENYREQMKLIAALKSMGSEFIRPHDGGAVPSGWRTPKVGPAFEGKPFSAIDAQGEPTVMYTRRWITQGKIANALENAYGKKPDFGTLTIAGKEFDPLAIIDWLTFVPKRAKLFASLFQQIDFLTRAGAGSWTRAADALMAGQPIEAIKAPVRFPATALEILKSNFSPTERLSLMEQLDDTTPLVEGREGITMKGISEAGLSTMDVTIFPEDMDKLVRQVADESGLGKTKRVLGMITELEGMMRRGLFNGVYPAAIMTDIKKNLAPMLARMNPNLTDAQINGEIARIANIKYSTIPASQSVFQNRVVREALRRIFFSTGEAEGLLRQAAGTVSGKNKKFWGKHWLGVYLFLIATANVIHFASTGEPLPKERYVPISKNNWGPLPFGYNSQFASPTLPFEGKYGEEITLDIVGQMDTACRIIDPGFFVESRISVPIRMIESQISGKDFYGNRIDEVGPGGVVSRTYQAIEDMYMPISATGFLKEYIRENVPEARNIVQEGESRIGLTGLGLQATGLNVRSIRDVNYFVEKLGKVNEEDRAEVFETLATPNDFIRFSDMDFTYTTQDLGQDIRRYTENLLGRAAEHPIVKSYWESKDLLDNYFGEYGGEAFRDDREQMRKDDYKLDAALVIWRGYKTFQNPETENYVRRFASVYNVPLNSIPIFQEEKVSVPLPGSEERQLVPSGGTTSNRLYESFDVNNPFK